MLRSSVRLTWAHPSSEHFTAESSTNSLETTSEWRHEKNPPTKSALATLTRRRKIPLDVNFIASLSCFAPFFISCKFKCRLMRINSSNVTIGILDVCVQFRALNRTLAWKAERRQRSRQGWWLAGRFVDVYAFSRRVSPNENRLYNFSFSSGSFFFRVALSQQVAASFDSFEFFFSESRNPSDVRLGWNLYSASRLAHNVSSAAMILAAIFIARAVTTTRRSGFAFSRSECSCDRQRRTRWSVPKSDRQ